MNNPYRNQLQAANQPLPFASLRDINDEPPKSSLREVIQKILLDNFGQLNCWREGGDAAQQIEAVFIEELRRKHGDRK